MPGFSKFRKGTVIKVQNNTHANEAASSHSLAVARAAFNASRAVLALMLAVSLVLCVCMPSTFAWSSWGQSVLNEIFGKSSEPEPGPEPVTEEGMLAIRNTVVRLDGVPLDEQDLNAEFLFQVVFYTADDNGQLTPEQKSGRAWRYAGADESFNFDDEPSVEDITTLGLQEKEASDVQDDASQDVANMEQQASDGNFAGTGFGTPVADKASITPSKAPSDVSVLEPLDVTDEASEDASEPEEVVYDIVLKHGQIAVFENLEAGLYYVVREIGVVDPALQGVYRALFDSHEGSIYESKIAHADFVNVRGAIGDEGNVALEKKVVRAGGDSWALTDAQKDEQFTFRATMTVPEEDESIDASSVDAATPKPLVSDTSEESLDADALSSAAGEASALADSDSEAATTSEVTSDDTSETSVADLASDAASISSSETTSEGELATSAAGATENLTYTYRLYERNSEGNLVPVMEEDPADPYNLRQVERAISGLADDEESVIVLKSGQVAVFEGLPDGVQWSFEEVLSEAQSSVYTPDKQRLSGTVIGGVRTNALFTNVAVEETVELTGTKTWEYPAMTDTDASDVEPVMTGSEASDAAISDSYTTNSEPSDAESTTADSEPVTEEDSSVSSAKLPIEAGLKTLEAEALAAIPESIVVTLVDAQGKDVETATVTPDETGAWKYTFTVPVYDVDGKLADTDAYTVRETSVTGWIPDYDDKSLDIANVYVGEKPTPEPEPDDPTPEPTPEPGDDGRVVLTPVPSGIPNASPASTMNKTGDPMFTVAIVLLIIAAISFIISIASFIYLRHHRKRDD